MELALAMNGVEAREASLVRRARAGDLSAFEDLLRQHERAVFLTALRLLGNREDAQDAAQEVFLRLYKHLGRFGDERQLRPWLYRVTINVCRDQYRKRRPDVPLEQAPELVGSSRDPQTVLAEQEQRRMVEAGLKTLAKKEREALVLRDMEGLPTSEVARILGTREVTVRSQVAKARLKIQKYVKRRL